MGLWDTVERIAGSFSGGSSSGMNAQERYDAVADATGINHPHDQGGRSDGLLNELSKLGGAKDKSTRNTVVRGERLTDDQIDVLYEENGYVVRIIDMPADDATRNGYTVSLANDEISDEDIENELDELGINEAMHKADKWARMRGGAIVLLGVDDGRSAEKPVDYANVRGVSFATPIDRRSLEIVEIERSAHERGTGEPRLFRISDDIFSAEDNPFDVGTVVHRDRVLYFPGEAVPPSMMEGTDFWGLDVINRCWMQLSNLIMAEHAIGHSVHNANQGIWKVKGLASAVDSKGLGRLIDRIASINISRSMLGMMLMDMDNEAYEQVVTNASNLVELHSALVRVVAAITGIPQVLLMGDSPSGMSTDDHAGTRNWNKHISSRQTEVYLPKIEKIVRLIMAPRLQVEYAELDDLITVDFNPLFEKTELEKRKEETERAKALQVYIQTNVVSRLEARAILRRDGYLPTAAEVTDVIESDDELPEEAVPSEEMPPEELGAIEPSQLPPEE